jgi:hypothetical protein
MTRFWRKRVISSKELISNLKELFVQIQKDLFQRAMDFVKTNTFEVKNFNEFVEILEN